MDRDDEQRQQELIEDLLEERKSPLLGDLSDDEAELARTVALLNAARPGALAPDAQFVAGLRERLFAENAGPASAPPPPTDPLARPERDVSRRGLLGALAAGAAGLALGGMAGHVAAEGEATTRVQAAQRQDAARWTATEARPYSVPLVGSAGQWITVARDDDVAPGKAVRFEAGALLGWLLRDPNGGYRAISATCTHMGCLLTWQEGSRRLLCPCHGSAYDAQGGVISGIARHPLPTIDVRVQPGGEVQVWTVATGATGSGVGTYKEP